MNELLHECCGRYESECTCNVKCVKCGKIVGEENSRNIVVAKGNQVLSLNGRICYDCYENSRR